MKVTDDSEVKATGQVMVSLCEIVTVSQDRFSGQGG